MNARETINDVCCEYCAKFEQTDCPVKQASPWSRWDYCCQFRHKIGDRTISEILVSNLFK